MFESSVNSEGIETLCPELKRLAMFESSVNSEGIETDFLVIAFDVGLRAV